jgi:hypothetical protein
MFAHLHLYPASIFEHLLWLSGPQRAILQLPKAGFYIIRQHWYPDHIVHLNMMDHSQVSKVSITIFPDIQVHVGVDIQGLYWSSSWFSWSIYTDVHRYPGYIFSILQISKIHFTHLYHGTGYPALIFAYFHLCSVIVWPLWYLKSLLSIFSNIRVHIVHLHWCPGSLFSIFTNIPDSYSSSTLISKIHIDHLHRFIKDPYFSSSLISRIYIYSQS